MIQSHSRRWRATLPDRSFEFVSKKTHNALGWERVEVPGVEHNKHGWSIDGHYLEHALRELKKFGWTVEEIKL